MHDVVFDPIRLEPAYQHYVWGGERIRTYFGRSIPLGRYAESWEVSDREEGMSRALNGKWKGKTLREIFQEGKEKIVGKGKSWEKFPLLVKVIDSKEHLSVQVHPDAEAAHRYSGEPKSEVWIALEKSIVYAGLKEGTTRETFAKAMDLGKVELLLKRFDLEKGEGIYIPAGQVHAIGPNSLLLEVQQNSNTTYRLYDWGRIGRQLHKEEGLSSIHWGKQEASKLKGSVADADGHHRLESLISCEYFVVERLDIVDRWQIKSHAKTCQIVFCLEGEADVGSEKIRLGETFLIPAASDMVPINGRCTLLAIRLS